MSRDKSIEEIRYEIIKPFLQNERSLKELSEESEISYSTLKRWVSAYKKKGKEGLQKSQRKDKDTHRSLNRDTYEFIRETYQSNPDRKIQDLHNLVNKRKKKSGERLISYDTVYRIINNLDPFVKKIASTNYPAAHSSNEAFEYFSFELDVKVLNETTDELEKPILHIVYDSFSKGICSFDISFQPLNIDEILVLLRSAIFPDETNSTSIYGKPQKFIINNVRMQAKKRLADAQRNSEIEIVFSSSDDSKVKKFMDEINGVYLKDYLINENKYPNYIEVFSLIKKYVEEIHNFRKADIWSNNLNKIEIITKKKAMDSLLIPIASKRKIQPTGIRYLNMNYSHDNFKEYVGKKVEIKLNYLDISKLYIYVNGFFLCEAYCENFMRREVSLYRFQSLKRYVLIKFYQKEFNLNDLGREIEILIKNGTY